MTRGQITRTRNTRTGISLGVGSLGWAIILRDRPKPHRIDDGDPYTLARNAAENWNHKENGPFTLFAYLNAAAFSGSRAARDGMPREKHAAMVTSIANDLAREGFNITICEVE